MLLSALSVQSGKSNEEKGWDGLVNGLRHNSIEENEFGPVMEEIALIGDGRLREGVHTHRINSSCVSAVNCSVGDHVQSRSILYCYGEMEEDLEKEGEELQLETMEKK